MKRSGIADLPLHYGHVPKWLAERMAKLGLAITEAIITDFGKDEYLKRMSDPFWFQSLGCVLGMDWHSSGITTSVLGALKSAINPLSKELGIYFCGGKGKFSRNTPHELLVYGEKNGLNSSELIRSSKLVAKVDNTAIQDGHQLYLHSFIVSNTGEWTVVQQGMHDTNSSARRYHWHSKDFQSFTEKPHAGICGTNQGLILDMTAVDSKPAKTAVMNMTTEKPNHLLAEISHLVMPKHHDVKSKDVDLKRLGAMLWLAHEKQPKDFDELLLLEGLGPRTLQSLALVSEVIYGTPTRFQDPARFSFAHGGKDGHPFPVLTKVYDETIDVLTKAITQSKLGNSDKKSAIESLSRMAYKFEKDFTPNNNFEQLLQKERDEAWKYGGKTVFGDAKPPVKNQQLSLFDN
ncbi:protein of unknown function DUF763 [Pseudopedobacter saltans DSM 12145]|uniref:DUF763 domain-containing protein n=1 Tax=Pseudopedobacter saltans (strain ATCC 51119 / DSM 12145 / JCM 21818 / CCUG 39354 / LMG 10337 / NBRC 100064 / NCIMB 13643) TaxID=762903 RepID=F0SC94_PSESL|nr:DUF763 domain-containing protein [Pseudopedobacter saltans]ADY51691.1 protein of unknown function DUF763 [Pseudopedobacter saltans DSM 12145]